LTHGGNLPSFSVIAASSRRFTLSVIHTDVSPFVAENRCSPRLKRGRLLKIARMSAVSGTLCGRAFPFLPFILAAGIVQIPFAKSNSLHTASATSFNRSPLNNSKR
jgi:hypothetical protein